MNRKLLVVLAALVLAGCTTSVTGSPVPVAGPTGTRDAAGSTSSVAPVRHVDPDHVTAADALGDIKTVSPCSLIQITAVPPRFGPARIIAADNIDDCELYLGSGTYPVFATVGILEDYATASDGGVKRFLDRSGGMRIAVLDDDELGCDESLVFADNTTMGASVFPAGDKATHMCDLATALLDEVIATVTGDDGPRHREYPDGSLAHADACQLLSAHDAGLAKGIGTAKMLAKYPAHHRCLYQGTGSRRVQVSLDFAVFDDTGDDTGETSAVIAGHDSVIRPDPHPGDGANTYCIVITKHGMIDDAGSPDAQEDAEVLVRVEHGQHVPCDEAKKVAAAVWKKLP